MSLMISYFLFFTNFILFFKILFIFRERAREGEREGEKHQCVVASRAPPNGHVAHNPRMCPDWKSNLWSFDSHVSTQSTEPHQPGQMSYFYEIVRINSNVIGRVLDLRMGCNWRAPEETGIPDRLSDLGRCEDRGDPIDSRWYVGIP